MFLVCRIWARLLYWTWLLPHGNWGPDYYAVSNYIRLTQRLYLFFFNKNRRAQDLANVMFPYQDAARPKFREPGVREWK